jgi:hypothetical protein
MDAGRGRQDIGPGGRVRLAIVSHSEAGCPSVISHALPPPQYWLSGNARVRSIYSGL